MKTSTTAADLQVLIEREFKRARVPECAVCRVPAPFRVEGRRLGAPNWDLIPPLDCPDHCLAMLGDVVRRLQARYRLET